MGGVAAQPNKLAVVREVMSAYYSQWPVEWKDDTYPLPDVVVRAMAWSSFTGDNVPTRVSNWSKHVSKISWPDYHYECAVGVIVFEVLF